MLADFLNGGGAGRQDPRAARFGKRAVPVTHEFHNWEYLQSAGGNQWKPARGTRTTRFHKGFQRRNQSEIGQDCDRKQHEVMQATRRRAATERRREYLDSRDKKNGFNVLTGKTFGTQEDAPPVQRKQRKHFDQGHVSEFLQREGDVLLRTSASRFHRPERVTTEKRTQRLVDEGLKTTVKYSSLLGIGRNDMKSYGVADNFTMSDYPWNQRPSTTGAPSMRPPTHGGRNTPARSVASAGNPVGVLSGTARSMMGSARSGYSIASKPPRDPELRATSARDDVGSVAASRRSVGSRGGASVYSSRSVVSNASRRSYRSSRSRVSRMSQRERVERAADIAFVRSLPQ